MIVVVILVFDNSHEQCIYSGAMSDVQKCHLWIQGRVRCRRPLLLVRCWLALLQCSVISTAREGFLRTTDVTLLFDVRSLPHTLAIGRMLCTLFALKQQGDCSAAAKSCPTLCDPIDGSPPGSRIPGILQARTLEWVVISSSNAVLRGTQFVTVFLCQNIKGYF